MATKTPYGKRTDIQKSIENAFPSSAMVRTLFISIHGAGDFSVGGFNVSVSENSVWFGGIARSIEAAPFINTVCVTTKLEALDGWGRSFSLYLDGEEHSDILGEYYSDGNAFIDATDVYTVEVYDDYKDFDWYLARRQQCFDKLLTGSFAQQSISVGSDVGFSFDSAMLGDNSVICILGADTNDNWSVLYYGDGTSDFVGRLATCPANIKKIAFGSKYGTFGEGMVLDNITTNHLGLSWVEIPLNRKRQFISLLTKVKPLKTWGVLLVRWT